MTHDYKAALADLDFADIMWRSTKNKVTLKLKTVETIRHALTLAQALQNDPTDAMLAKGMVALQSFGRTSNGLANAWRVMVEEMK